MTPRAVAIRAIRVTHAIEPAAPEPWPFSWAERLAVPVSVTHSLFMTEAEFAAWARAEAAVGETG